MSWVTPSKSSVGNELKVNRSERFPAPATNRSIATSTPQVFSTRQSSPHPRSRSVSNPPFHTALLSDAVLPSVTKDSHAARASAPAPRSDRKSTRLNSSHRTISYAVFCLKKKKTKKETEQQ